MCIRVFAEAIEDTEATQKPPRYIWIYRAISRCDSAIWIIVTKCAIISDSVSKSSSQQAKMWRTIADRRSAIIAKICTKHTCPNRMHQLLYSINFPFMYCYYHVDLVACFFSISNASFRGLKGPFNSLLHPSIAYSFIYKLHVFPFKSLDLFFSLSSILFGLWFVWNTQKSSQRPKKKQQQQRNYD